jgi:hypothetical protein
MFVRERWRLTHPFRRAGVARLWRMLAATLTFGSRRSLGAARTSEKAMLWLRATGARLEGSSERTRARATAALAPLAAPPARMIEPEQPSAAPVPSPAPPALAPTAVMVAPPMGVPAPPMLRPVPVLPMPTLRRPTLPPPPRTRPPAAEVAWSTAVRQAREEARTQIKREPPAPPKLQPGDPELHN